MARTPGFASQTRYRTVFRVVGVVVFPLSLILLGTGFYTFATSELGFGETGLPPGFGRFLIGMLLLPVGGFFLNAGFAGAAARYAAGETMPVVRDSASYLTDGQGVAGIGRTVDDRPGASATGAGAAGPFCRSCGVRNDDDASYCDGCGQSLA